MAAKKVYTLELTAEELEAYEVSSMALESKLRPLAKQARADREVADLRLPWRAEQHPALTRYPLNSWRCIDAEGHEVHVSERAAKLRSAAPELHAAVKAVMTLNWWIEGCAPGHPARELILRALRKVKTGVPE